MQALVCSLLLSRLSFVVEWRVGWNEERRATVETVGCTGWFLQGLLSFILSKTPAVSISICKKQKTTDKRLVYGTCTYKRASSSTVPSMFSCLIKTVWYISVSLNQLASSVVKKTLTATFSPLHLPIHTSPYLPFPICFIIWICLAIVLWTWRRSKGTKCLR